ncbi:hypothetical protein [Paenibacillus xerothermodurans]|uniref:Uncharacterized protein n=1 Tax=Paenibacillus xerothermodurans TaxID=1977292 RepID=A0A2W1NGB2_PAEXE|nr:hypothetical protein [Paenibacillus xerothermodurans]PZE22121.1 hypothetical protein CBW46_006975 [Paenibacillus xerothermodurans]
MANDDKVENPGLIQGHTAYSSRLDPLEVDSDIHQDPRREVLLDMAMERTLEDAPSDDKAKRRLLDEARSSARKAADDLDA